MRPQRSPAEISERSWDRAVAAHEAACAAAAAGRLDDAIAGSRRAVRGLARAVGRTHPDYANAELALGRHLLARGDVGRALAALRRAVACLRAPSERVVVQLAVDARLAVASCLQQLGELAGARIAAQAALALANRHLGARSVLAAAAHNQLGVIGKFAGRFASADRHYRRALPVYRRAFGARSREVASVLHNLGGLDHARGQFARAERPARAAVAIAQAILPAADPERLAHEVALGGILDGLGRQRESIPIYRRALAAFTRRFGRAHFEVASTLHNLAAAEHVLGRTRLARRHYGEACRLLHQLRGASDPDLALARHNLAILHRDAGEPSTARRLLRASLAALRRRLGDRHPSTRACSAALVRLRT